MPGGGNRISHSNDAAIRDTTFRHFPDGFTILNADGGWFDPERKEFLEEESRQVLVCAESSSALQAWCTELAEALRQKELLVIELGPATIFRRAARA